MLLECLRGAAPGAAEYPDATGVPYVTMVHWSQMPAVLPADSRYVYLYRRDRVAQAVSWAYSAGASRYHSSQPEGVTPEYDRYAVAVLLARIAEECDAWEEWLHGRPVLPLCFEEDIHPNPMTAAARVLTWCGIPGEPAEPHLRPIEQAAKREWRDIHLR